MPRTTAHGAQRIAGSAATRGGVLAVDEITNVEKAGTLFKANNGATVRLMQQPNGRFSAVVRNSNGQVVTTIKNWSQRSIDRIARNYGWRPVR